MNGGFKIHEASWRRVELALRNVAEKVPQHAARTVRRAAARIVKRARNYVPEEEGDLMNSIRIEAELGVGRRLQIRVVAGGQEVIKANGRFVNLDQYAAIIHEHYEAILASGPEGGPSKRTLEKMERFPGKVGSGFLTRAAEEEGEALNRACREAVADIIKTEFPT